MPKSDGFKDFVLDQLVDVHGLTDPAMFGGHGLPSNGPSSPIIMKAAPDSLHIHI